MTIGHSTCLWLVQEPTQSYQTDSTLLVNKHATVQTTSYPPLKSDPGCGAWRKILWLNHRGWWLEQAGFNIGMPYTIEVYDKKLVFTAE